MKNGEFSRRGPRGSCPRVTLIAATLLATIGHGRGQSGGDPEAAPLTSAATRAAEDADLWWSSLSAQYLDRVEKQVQAKCAQLEVRLPEDFLNWVKGDALVRTSVFGCSKEPLYTLLALRSLEIDLGQDIVRRQHKQLALAFAIQDAYSPRIDTGSTWNDNVTTQRKHKAGAMRLPDISPRPRLELVIPGDPRQRVDTKDPGRDLDEYDHVINFLEDHEDIEVEVMERDLAPLEYDEKGVAIARTKTKVKKKHIKRGLVGADVIASAALQREFNAYMSRHGCSVSIECGDQIVSWFSTGAVSDRPARKRIAAAHELFHTAYKDKGRMPAVRDVAPTASESMAWFVSKDQEAETEGERFARRGPRFPLTAPWPVLLMLAADDQPLREREDVWAKFRADSEIRTYGEYIHGIAQQFDMQSARRVAPFAFSYGSIQMMWKDGGVCGTMGNIGARTYRICGIPASTAPQPGHCALVRMTHSPATGDYSCVGGQYATGGDEVTTVHAGWNYDDVGAIRPMVYHQTVAWGVSRGFEPYLDGLVLLRAWIELDGAVKAERAVALVRQTMNLSPFSIGLLATAIQSASNANELIEILDVFDEQMRAIGHAKKFRLYIATVRKMAHARLASLLSAADSIDTAAVLAGLERHGASPDVIAKCWLAIDGQAGFTARCRDLVKEYLASKERAKSEQARADFAARVMVWSKSLPGGKATASMQRAWALAVLQGFADQETLKLGQETKVDPAVVALRQLAGLEPLHTKVK